MGQMDVRAAVADALAGAASSAGEPLSMYSEVALAVSHLSGVKSSSHSSTPMAVSAVPTTASPKGTAV